MKYMEETMKTNLPAPETNEDDLPPVRSGAITLTSQGVSSYHIYPKCCNPFTHCIRETRRRMRRLIWVSTVCK